VFRKLRQIDEINISIAIEVATLVVRLRRIVRRELAQVHEVNKQIRVQIAAPHLDIVAVILARRDAARILENVPLNHGLDKVHAPPTASVDWLIVVCPNVAGLALVAESALLDAEPPHNAMTAVTSGSHSTSQKSWPGMFGIGAPKRSTIVNAHQKPLTMKVSVSPCGHAK